MIDPHRRNYGLRAPRKRGFFWRLTPRCVTPRPLLAIFAGWLLARTRFRDDGLFQRRTAMPAVQLLLRSLRTVPSEQRMFPRAIRDIKPRKEHKSDPLATLENLQAALTGRTPNHASCRSLSGPAPIMPPRSRIRNLYSSRDVAPRAHGTAALEMKTALLRLLPNPTRPDEYLVMSGDVRVGRIYKRPAAHRDISGTSPLPE